jgi:hypothetical protein
VEGQGLAFLGLRVKLPAVQEWDGLMRWLIAIGLLCLMSVAAQPARAAPLTPTLCAPYEAAWSKVGGSANLGQIGPVADGMPFTCPSKPQAVQVATMLRAKALAQAVVAGTWKSEGLSCDDPVRITLNDGILSVATGGQAAALTLQPSPQFGITEAVGEDGDYSFIPQLPPQRDKNDPTPPPPPPPPGSPPPLKHLVIEGPNGTVGRLEECR